MALHLRCRQNIYCFFDGSLFDTAAIKFTGNPSQTPCQAKRGQEMRKKKKKHGWKKKVAAIKVIIHLCLRGAGTTDGWRLESA